MKKQNMFPVRCFTCNKVIADKYLYFQREKKKGKSMETILNHIRVRRYCCRRMFLTHVQPVFLQKIT